jgi:hypothetical protein
MFIEKDLIIKNCNMGCPRMTGVKEEDLDIFAPRCLDDFYCYHHPLFCDTLGLGDDSKGIPQMMAALPYVAEHYNVDKQALLEKWTAEFGLFRMRNDQ